MQLSTEYLEKLKKSPHLQELEWMLCKSDPYYWLTTWCKTLDVHDETGEPSKPFPEKEYIRILVDKWIEEKVLFIPKSRQMMMSWLFVALYLWDTQFNEARFTAFQSKKQDDADALIKRLKHIWDNEPNFLKRYYKKWVKWGYIDLQCNPQNRGGHIYAKFDLPQINSFVIGIPQWGDVIRSYTLSGMLSDESAFQPEMESAYTALKPTLSKQWRFTCVSTAEDNTWFELACFDGLPM